MSPEVFNRITKLPLICPITNGGSFTRNAGFAVALTGAGTKTAGIVSCNQPRVIGLTARSGKMLESLPAAIMDEVMARLAPI